MGFTWSNTTQIPGQCRKERFVVIKPILMDQSHRTDSGSELRHLPPASDPTPGARMSQNVVVQISVQSYNYIFFTNQDSGIGDFPGNISL